MTYNTIEVGAIGHFTSDSKHALIDVLPLELVKMALLILVKASLVAITASQQIFAAHKL